MTVLVGIVLVVGLWVFDSVKSQINPSNLNIWSASANTTYTNIVNASWNGFQLAVVSIIVIAATVLIGILSSAFRFGGTEDETKEEVEEPQEEREEEAIEQEDERERRKSSKQNKRMMR